MWFKMTVAATIAMGLGVGACSDNEPSKTASNEETVRSELAQATTLQPGQYAANVEVIRVDVPGLPAEQAKMLGGMMSSSTAVEHSYCLTPEQASRSGRDMFAEMAKGDGNCQFADFDVDGDRVSGHLTCTGGRGGATSAIALDGTMQAASSDVHMTMTVNDSHMPQGRMEVEMRAVTRRTGECTAASAAAAQ
ncbi:MAG: DUF3617 domain-containing protein [Sphingopyxis sp.]